ncbi:MAG TPA: translation initiation factor IF-1 [Candidatus Paceibacterota bacterium]|nr:translation initiation factor IF-1 [Candidatus Paceibacterota bacterium]
MDKKDGQNIVTGIVTESLPNALFRVEIDKDKVVLSYLSGKMRIHRIKVLVGDSVDVLLDPYGGKGRIIKRN